MTGTRDLSPTVPPATGPGAPEPRGRSGVGRVLLVVGVTFAALAAVWGGVHLVDLALTDTTRTQDSYGASPRVELVADGEVTVRAADDATGVDVDLVSRGGLVTPEHTVQELGDALVVTNECPPWAALVSWTCSGGIDAVVPAGTEVVVRTSNGDVLAAGPVGSADIDTSNGRVRAEGVGGDLVARSSNGDVEAVDVDGRAELRTSNGGIEVRDVTGDVDARTSNGRVDVAAVTGDLTAQTSNGRVEVSDVGGSADVRSSNGRVDVAAVAGDVFARTSNGDVTVVGDGEPVRLTLDTSNGDEIIEGATDPAATRSVEIRSSNGDVAFLAP
ncbi:hypothetical protein ATJ88_3309 [Isoptericola jiangsuensis]|uniref:Uncharacterized protein n=1 Tax=Isoptericola jiangsuensis TaxID=548579 RepID=A0A2A9F237_9MICO|nr:DUF4097 family beta strand repeat-containing protein [Isoptericola jiangsuensis]PFG44580.1 hypothetical protein ATJ88_3309 [Isoptericola jiangsuensis]